MKGPDYTTEDMAELFRELGRIENEREADPNCSDTSDEYEAITLGIKHSYLDYKTFCNRIKRYIHVNSKDYILSNVRKHLNELLTMSLEDIPLYINKDMDYIKLIVRWRLRINK